MKPTSIQNLLITVAWGVILTQSWVCQASEPIVQTSFTADPAPMVHDGVVYLYTSHDDDNAPPGQGRFLMRDWKCYSSTDMVNWTDHGSVASLKTFPWAVQENDAWAPHVIERNGLFYFYAPVSVPGWPKNVIAVAVADNPLGPFEDALGRPLIDKEVGYIDPGVLIDDDGQAYLYFGNPQVWYVKLNEDMISYEGEVVTDPSFVKVRGQRDPYHYQEGPWPFKHDDKYYLAYAATCCPEGIGYAMSDSPIGPWEYKGYIMPPDRRATGNHPGIIEFKGNHYVFGFNFKLNFAITDKHHERRSVCVAKITFNPDGTIQELPWWEEADPVEQIGTVDPYVQTEAETICWSEGMKSETSSQGGLNVYPTREDAYIKVKGVNFGEGADSFTASVAGSTEQARIELYLDHINGQHIGTLAIGNTDGQWKSEIIAIEEASGIRDLFFVFKGESLGKHCKFDYWQFDGQQKYQPTFLSLEKASPVPEWFKDAKFGIYFHWGVYSVPAFANEWYPRNMYRNGSNENKHHINTYGEVTEWPYHNFITGAQDKQGRFKQFAPKLKSEGGQFDPEEWAQLFADSGAKFAGPVAEHHDGFSMWDSDVNPWNANDMGPKLDLVGLLTDAIRKRDMKVILSMHHAYNITGFFDAVPKTDDPKLQMLYGQQGKEKNEGLWLEKHREIIDMYRPDIIWQDFNLHIISNSVLLEFLAYYYNQATDWGKEVVATYKDGLNDQCAVLDYERGGPADITQNYWLTDDAISSSSWCYTEGIGYYSQKQILHGFLDRISKNGNLLLNLSPKADGSIPEEQRAILHTMGAWLKKYGEAVYATRAWEKFGEGPTKMGSGHGVFTAPAEGTAKDVRYTRSKDNTTLYAILLGWEERQQDVLLTSLSSDRIELKNLKSVELINGQARQYLSLDFMQNANGLAVNLPERSFKELAYVLKLNFDGTIPMLDQYANLDCSPHYYIASNNSMRELIVGPELTLIERVKLPENQWKLERTGKGIYKIMNRQYDQVLAFNPQANLLMMVEFSDNDGQLWEIDNSSAGSFKISNKQHPEMKLALTNHADKGRQVDMSDVASLWKLIEVCELEQQAFKAHTIPGTIEAEDFDLGCFDEAFRDSDQTNEGGKYRLSEGVDIEACSAGGFNVGWTRRGEWLAYTVTVERSATYKIAFHIASDSTTPRIHLECDGQDLTGQITIPNTAGYQNWKVIEQTADLSVGEHVLKLVIDSDSVNFDKMVIEQVK